MLNDPETATVPLRYFQGRRVVHSTAKPLFELAWADVPERPAGPMPARISERVLFTPDSKTYCCEITPSLWVEVLGMEAEWDEEVSDELREWWDEQLSHPDFTGGEDGYYVHYHSVVNTYEKDGPVTFAGWFVTTVHEDGEFETPEDAREYAQGNWHV